MTSTLTEQLWLQLLALKQKVSLPEQSTFCIGFSVDGFELCQSIKDTKSGWPVLISDKPLNIERYSETEVFSGKLYLNFAESMGQDVKSMLTLYLPLATTSLHHPNQCFVIVHMAQSLDGMVCTKSGSSKWIGNQENLTHAHRLRALVDGVVVGGKTARQEHPSLNVRHVPGPDPARLLLCNSSDCLQDLPDIQGMRNFILCEEGKLGELSQEVLASSNLKPIGYQKCSGDIDLQSLLNRLCSEGIRSILLEGGPTTINTFLRNNALHWIQLHIAPLVFGSGKPFLTLPEIDSVDQAVKLSSVFYTPMGDAIMVTGHL